MRLLHQLLNQILQYPVVRKAHDQKKPSPVFEHPPISGVRARLVQRLLGTCCILCIWPSAIWAAQVSLAWDACTNPVPEGYHIYHRLEGQQYNYSDPIWTGNATSCTLSNLADGDVRYFVIRSYAGSRKSANSIELRYDPTSSIPDADQDGVEDGIDPFTDDPAQWQDMDDEGIGDNFDPDDDDDGMPNKWESLHRLDPLKDDAGQDADGDGASNLQEYQADTNPNSLPGNHGPDQPVMIYPTNGAADIELNLKLEAGDFSDPDSRDAHARSQWQIINAQSQESVLDITDDETNLDSMPVPHLMLDAETAYICRVQYFDKSGEGSPWSAGTEFITAADMADSNKNGIADDQEVSDEVDLDNDGTADNQQDTIQSVYTPDGLNQMGISIKDSPTAAKIASVAALNVQDLPGSPFFSDETPFGLLGYKIQVAQAGDKATVKFLYSKGLDPQIKWLDYDSIAGFQDCTDRMQPVEDAYGVRLQLQDGGPGDADGVANGWIVNASGPVSAVDTQNSGLSGTDSSQAGGGGGCFIGSLFK